MRCRYNVQMQLIEVNSRKLQIMDIELCYFDVTKFG